LVLAGRNPVAAAAAAAAAGMRPFVGKELLWLWAPLASAPLGRLLPTVGISIRRKKRLRNLTVEMKPDTPAREKGGKWLKNT